MSINLVAFGMPKYRPRDAFQMAACLVMGVVHDDVREHVQEFSGRLPFGVSGFRTFLPRG